MTPIYNVQMEEDCSRYLLRQLRIGTVAKLAEVDLAFLAQSDQCVVVVFKRSEKMNSNAWQKIKPGDYDLHMSHPLVAQTQMLSRITKEQFDLLINRSKRSVAMLGITNGNGLEHVVPCRIEKIIGIDINKAFLDECRNRFVEIETRLDLYQLDLTVDISKTSEIIAGCDLIIANLLIKHIHLENFIKVISGLPNKRQIVSCTVQKNPDGSAVSRSGYEHVFGEIAEQREEEKEELIISAMTEYDFFFINHRHIYDLPNGKQFVRLDFISK